VLSLIDALDKKVKSGCPDKRDCISAYQYVNLKTDALLHLGIFIDPKFLEMVADPFGYASRYTGFYERYDAMFTKEEHFMNLFMVMRQNTYDSYNRNSVGLNASDEAEFVNVLAQNEYVDAFRLFIPLSSSSFRSDSRGPIAVLEAALSLENTLGTKEFITESIAHTTYQYSSSDDKCELEKFDFTFHALRESDNLDEHIDQLFTQIPVQCAANS
jgi:hypothetical protein